MIRRLGVIDSGLGGLSVLNPLRDAFPHVDMIYVGDFGHAPYGTKDKATVSLRVHTVYRWLLTQNIDAFVIACNTATLAVDLADFNVPTFDVVTMNLAGLQAKLKSGKVLVLGTDLTIASHVYQKRLRALGYHEVSLAAQSLVTLVEGEPLNTAKSHRVVRETLTRYIGRDVAAIILGCTHFSWIKVEIQSCFPQAILIDGIRELSSRLQKQIISNSQTGQLTLVTTESKDSLDRMKTFLSNPSNKEIQLKNV